MSEHIYEDSDMENERYHVIPFGWKREEIVRCRDCAFAYRVYWPESADIPPEFRNCQGPLVSLWDYERDEPKMNPVEPDGYCKWGERMEL